MILMPRMGLFFGKYEMKNLYARVVLFLIRPALELHLHQTKRQRYEEVNHAALTAITMDKKSGIRTALESIYNLKRP